MRAGSHLRATVLALASLSVGAVCVAPRAALAQQAAPRDEAAARERYQRGRAAFERGQYADALEAFRASYAASDSPNTLLYIARSLRELGRAAEAYDAFARTADAASVRAATEPRYAPAAQAARDEGRALLPRVAIVMVSVRDAPDGAVVRLDGREVPRDRWSTELAFEPGAVRVEAEAPGRAAYRESLTVSPGVVNHVDVRLGTEATTDAPPLVTTPPGTPPPVTITVTDPGTGRTPTRPTPFLVGLAQPVRPAHVNSPLIPAGGALIGAGLLLGVGALITGVAAQNAYDGLSLTCGEMDRGHCSTSDANARMEADRGRALVVATNVQLVAGGGALLLGAVLFGIGRAAENAQNTAHARGPRAVPFVDVARGTAGVQGVF
jgi:hypothetical protein